LSSQLFSIFQGFLTINSRSAYIFYEVFDHDLAVLGMGYFRMELDPEKLSLEIGERGHRCVLG
jgi:hypothetical protein